MENIIKNKKIISLIIGIFIMWIMMFSFAISQETACCEKTTSGMWCQNEVVGSCDAQYLSAPTSCDSTSFCKTGCCFDSQEGVCWENTPQRVCQERNGTWADDSECNIRQCNLGCCVLGDQAALVTMTRCKALSGFYGLGIDYRPEISNEVQCIAVANAQDKGACVFEEQDTGALSCKFTTRGECSENEQTIDTNQTSLTNTSKIGFYKDVLC